jgi:hypothetical protein
MRLLLQFLDLPTELVFALLKFDFPLAEPHPRRAEIGFELTGAGVDRGLAAIDFAQPLAEVAGELRDLQLELLAADFGGLTHDGSDHLTRRLPLDFEQHRLELHRARRLGLFRSYFRRELVLARGRGARTCATILGTRMRRIDARSPRGNSYDSIVGTFAAID